MGFRGFETFDALSDPRPKDSHKGDYGKILIIAGSDDMPGAATLAGRAALRSGAGLVTVSIEGAARASVAALTPELTFTGRDFAEADLNDYDAVLIGPGLGKNEGKLMSYVLENYDGRLVIDADGLNMAAEDGELKEQIFAREGGTILTPHKGEAARLFGKNFDKKIEDIVREDLVVVRKGHKTIISGSEGIFENRSGNPGMATAGSGDVLAGIIAALLAQKLPKKLSVFDAAFTGVALHSIAGDIAAANRSERSLIASDIISGIFEFMLMEGDSDDEEDSDD
jgi:NAD(P)H-hydrate epimerase